MENPLKETGSSKPKESNPDPGAETKKPADEAQKQPAEEKPKRKAQASVSDKKEVMARVMLSNGIPKVIRAKVLSAEKDSRDIEFQIGDKPVTYSGVKKGSPKDNKLICPRWWAVRAKPEPDKDKEAAS